jgi:hypothetical protein
MAFAKQEGKVSSLSVACISSLLISKRKGKSMMPSHPKAFLAITRNTGQRLECMYVSMLKKKQ